MRKEIEELQFNEDLMEGLDEPYMKKQRTTNVKKYLRGETNVMRDSKSTIKRTPSFSKVKICSS